MARKGSEEWLVVHVRIAHRVAVLALAAASLAVLGHAVCLGVVSPQDVAHVARAAVRALFGLS